MQKTVNGMYNKGIKMEILSVSKFMISRIKKLSKEKSG